MVTPEIYIAANAPTVAEGALIGVFWGEIPSPYTYVARSLDHAARYGVPRTQYRDAILAFLAPALKSEEGLARLLKKNMWRSPGPQNIKAYLLRDWETELTLPQVFLILKSSI